VLRRYFRRYFHRRGRMRRWVVRPFIWGLFFLILVVAAVWIFLESGYAHERAAKLVIARTSELLGRRIQVRRIDYSLIDLSFEMYDLVVPGPRPGDPDFARVPLARVEFSWRDLRQRILRLEQIEVVRPHIYLRFEPDGTSNLPELRTRKGATRRFEVQIGRVLVENGTLDLDEMRFPLNLDAKAVFGRAIGSAERGGEGRDRIDVMVAAQDVVTTLPRAKPYGFTASAKGSFVPGRLRFTTLRMSGPDLKATGEGSYEWGQGKQRKLALEVAADGWAQLANRLGYVQEPLEGPFDFRGRIERTGDRLTYAGTVRSPRLNALHRTFEEIEAGLVGGRDGMEIELERASYAGGSVEGVISVDYRDDESERSGTPVDLDLTFARLDLGTVAADQFGEDVPVVQDLAGRATGDLVYRFRTGAPTAGNGLVDVHLDAVHEKGVPIAGDASINIESGTLSSDSIRLTAPSQTVTGSSFLFDMERGAGHFDFQLASKDVGVLAPLLRGDVRPGEEPPFWVPSAGAGNAEGRVTIADKRFAADVRIDLRDAVSPVVAADTVRGSFRFTPSAVENLALEATAGGGALTVTGRVPLEEEGRRRRAPQPLSLAVYARQWPAPGIVAFLAPGLKDMGIDGTVTGRLDLGGTTENLNGRAEIEVAGFRVADADVGTLQAGIAFQGKQVRIERAVTETPAGLVLVSGTFDTETKAMDLTVDAPELSLAADPFRDLLGSEIGGRAALAAVIGGTLDRPEAMASLRGTGLALAGRPLGEAGEAQAVATWTGDTLTATGSLLGLITFEGGGALTMERADLRFDVESADLGTLIRIASPRPVPEITGSFAGTVGFASQFDQGTYRGELVLSDLRAQYQGHTIANKEPVVVELGPERAVIRSFYMGEPETENELFVSGAIGLGETAALDLRLQSTIAATWAELFLPSGFDVEGYLDVLAVVRGTASDPRLDGQGVIRDARVLIPNFPQALEDVTGVVLFNRDALVLDGLQARMGDGTLRAAGRLDIPTPQKPGFEARLQVEADGVSVRFPEPFLLRGDANLSFVASGSSRQIRGRVLLERAFFLQDVQTETLPLLLQALERQRLEVQETDELLAGTQLDVQVDGPNALRVRNNVADLRGDIDLRVQGTLAAPVVFGKVEADPGGRLTYSDNEYEVERFLLTFNNPNRIDPIIDLVARTEVRSYDVTLNLSGTLDRLDTQFTSDEGLAELEVLALLFSGEVEDYERGRPRAPGEQGPEQDLRAGSFLAGQAASLVSRRVNTLFGFDRFRIDPQATETGAALGGVRLTVGKRISRDLFVTYTTNPASSEEYLLRIEWQVARNVVLVFTRNGRDDTYAVDAQWEKRY
jgi:hypothetical protein